MIHCVYCDAKCVGGTCKKCLKLRAAQIGLTGEDARLAVARAGGTDYLNDCPEHGKDVDFSVDENLCYQCVPEQGNARARARNANEAFYVSFCPEHGHVDFMTRHGKCATCFRSDGRTRMNVRSGPKGLKARIAARDANLPSYIWDCFIHGETAFSTGPGKCLICCNAQGKPRPAFRCDPT